MFISSKRRNILLGRGNNLPQQLNSENTRKILQNQFAHDMLTGGVSKWFNVLDDLKSKWYWGFGYSGGGTLW